MFLSASVFQNSGGCFHYLPLVDGCQVSLLPNYPHSHTNVPFCILQVSPNDDGLVHKATLPLLSHLRQAIPFNPLSANLTRWSNTLTGCQPTNCLSVFDHFVGLALKGLIISLQTSLSRINKCVQ